MYAALRRFWRRLDECNRSIEPPPRGWTRNRPMAFVRWASLPIAVLVISLIQFVAWRLPVTGDEPEYIYYAYSFFIRQDFSMPIPTFYAAFPQLASIPPKNLQIYSHPVLFSILGSPFVGLFGIAGARFFSFCCGLVGFIAVRKLVMRITARDTATAISLFTFVTFPVVAYLHVFYTDIAILAVIAWAWLLIESGRPTGLLAASGLAVTLPFLHVRMSLVAAWLVLLTMCSVLRVATRRRERAVLGSGIALIAIAAFGVFIWHQEVMFHKLVGGSTTPIPVTLMGYFQRLALQALDFRHGLITYNPAMILAFAGLLVGITYRSRIAIEAFGLLLVYSASFVWGLASESYPARFWVPAAPALAVGFGLWLSRSHSVSAYLAGTLLGTLSLLNLIIHILDQTAFLNNRQASLSYDSMFEVFPYLNLAGLFPWDAFNYTDHSVKPHPELSFPIMTSASIVAVLLIAAFALEATNRSKRRLVALLPPVILLVPFWYGIMRTVPSSAMQVVRTEDDDRHLRSILMTFCQPIDATLIRFFGSPRALMVPPTYPDELFIEGSRDGRDFQIAEAYPTSPVIVLPSGPFRSIRISAFTSLQGHNWTNDRVSVLMKGSLPTCGASGMQR